MTLDPAPAALTLGATLSVLLPLCLGAAALTALAGGLLSMGERVALAYPLGAVLLTTALYALGRCGLRFDRGSCAAVAAGLTAACAGVAWSRRRRLPRGAPAALDPPPLASWLTVPIAALLGSKATFVLFELLHRPLSPWDSFDMWGFRAKVWTIRAGLVLDPHDPFYLGGAGGPAPGASLTAAIRPYYPPHVSLLQTWTAVWLGGWHDIFVNLPWGCYYLCGVLFVYATLVRRVPRSWAVIAAALLASLPLFVIHAAVAGYADLMLSVHFCAAAFAIYLWAAEERTPYLIIAVLFTASLPFIKLEGTPLAVAGAGAMTMQARSLRRGGLRWWLLAAAGVTALITALRIGAFRSLVTQSTVHVEALVPLLTSFAGLGNSHVLWPVFFVAGGLTLKRMWGTPLAWLFATVAAPLLPFLYLFVFTDVAKYAVQQTAPSRILLSLAPAALLFVVLAFAHACSRREDGPTRTAEPPQGFGTDPARPSGAAAPPPPVDTDAPPPQTANRVSRCVAELAQPFQLFL